IARISSGWSTTARSPSNRWVRTVVLPDPAGACRMIDRLGSIARARARSSVSPAAAGSGLDGLYVIEPPQAFLEGLVIRRDETVTHAADTGDMAELAGPRLRIHQRLSGGESLGQPLHQAMPFPDARLPRVL